MQGLNGYELSPRGLRWEFFGETSTGLRVYIDGGE
jgi:hypothetical protein